MNNKCMTQSVLFLSFLLYFTTACLADVVVTIETSGSGKSPSVGQMFVKGNKLRMKEKGDQAEQMIFRGDQRLMMTIDPDRKEYTRITQEDMKKIGAKMNDAMSQMEAQMANVPPAQRAMMEKMMGNVMGRMKQQKKSPPQIKKTNETQTISGFSCVKYEVLRDGKKTREYWVASPSALSGGKELKTAFEAMGSFFEQMLAAISKGPMADMIDNPYAEFAQINGVPIKTIQYKDGKVVRETLIKTVANEKLEMAMFEAPAGYSQRDMMRGMN